MFEITDAFDLYISEVLDEKLRALIKTDSEYAKLKTGIKREGEAMQDKFSAHEIRIMDEFYGLLVEVADIENKHLYFEGFRDCIRLLKRLELY